MTAQPVAQGFRGCRCQMDVTHPRAILPLECNAVAEANVAGGRPCETSPSHTSPRHRHVSGISKRWNLNRSISSRIAASSTTTMGGPAMRPNRGLTVTTSASAGTRRNCHTRRMPVEPAHTKLRGARKQQAA